MKILDQIKEKAMKIKKKMKTPGFWAIKVTLVAEHLFQKSVKKIPGLLKIHASKHVKIKWISYKIQEDLDPFIAKRREDAESISDKKSKTSYTLKEDEEKEVNFTLPIKFENHSGKKKGEGDMHLLNSMSERSKKTAINYILTIEIRYLLEKEKESRTKRLKHTIRFE